MQVGNTENVQKEERGSQLISRKITLKLRGSKQKPGTDVRNLDLIFLASHGIAVESSHNWNFFLLCGLFIKQ